MKDGFALFYIKDGIIYPVVMSKEQKDYFDKVISTIGIVQVVSHLPQGKAVDLKEHSPFPKEMEQLFCSKCGKVNKSEWFETCGCKEPDFRFKSHAEYEKYEKKKEKGDHK